MNEFLAELYETRGTIGSEDSSDVEKLAEAQILDSVLQSEGIDVDDLDDGTILKLAHEIFGDDSELVKSAMEGEGKDAEGKKCDDCGKADCTCDDDSSEEKTAEADLLGRIMAHSMVQELGQIEMEKDAAGKGEAARAFGGKALEALRGAAKGKGLREGIGQAAAGGKALKSGKALQKAKGSYGKGIMSAKGKAKAQALAGKKGAKAVSEGKKGLKGGALKALKGGAATGALYGGGAAGAGGAGYAMGKESSALDTLAEQRALEILAENGIDVDDGQDKLASAVEERAWALLAENGYVEE